MDTARFRSSPIGGLVPITVHDRGETWEHEAYVPSPLPDDCPALSDIAWASVVSASSAIARLDGAARRLPNPYVLARPALTEEAVSTSALEGTYAAIEDVLQAEFLEPSELSAETIEVRNYIIAAETALRLMREENLPICHRLIKEIHRSLLRGTRGDSPDSGEYRTRQNWIGEHRDIPVTESFFVPPPPGELLERGLDEWEAWVNRSSSIPTVVRMSLAHYQFETLHPFVDGNGRVGRLVALLMLIAGGELSVPLVNLSPYLEDRKDDYVEHLRRVSETGDFEPWVGFLAEAVRVQSQRALAKADRLIETRDGIVTELHEARVRSRLAFRIAEDIVSSPVVTASRAADAHGVSFQAANTAIARLVDLGILREVTGRTYGRLFICPRVVEIIRARDATAGGVPLSG